MTDPATQPDGHMFKYPKFLSKSHEKIKTFLSKNRADTLQNKN